MTTATEPMTAERRRYYVAANRLYARHCHYWVEADCEYSDNDQRFCDLFNRLVALWATDAQKAALQTSGVPDPMLPLVTGPSVRRDLYALTRRERALGWVVGTAVRDPWALVCYLVTALSVSYVGWAMLAAVVEGRLRW